jgi:hypothetical protein
LAPTSEVMMIGSAEDIVNATFIFTSEALLHLSSYVNGKKKRLRGP